MWSYKMGRWMYITKLDCRPDFNYDPGTGERVFSCWIYEQIKLRVEHYHSGLHSVYICDHADFHYYSVPDAVRKVCDWWVKDPGWGGLQFHEYIDCLIKPPIGIKDRGKHSSKMLIDPP